MNQDDYQKYIDFYGDDPGQDTFAGDDHFTDRLIAVLLGSVVLGFIATVILVPFLP